MFNTGKLKTNCRTYILTMRAKNASSPVSLVFSVNSSAMIFPKSFVLTVQ